MCHVVQLCWELGWGQVKLGHLCYLRTYASLAIVKVVLEAIRDLASATRKRRKSRNKWFSED
ncbi:hypothetical protein WG66_016401 [Moniliophthora roreri]|nr:hypothetical protein WG66_016401 [Moniliophthora roreri]